ncbi:hypothetical protein MalM25_18300 [Planctomycetes bacterium MalM25]|nr:hypothetical protein MalM25_18300 [Planctomycetes bacterium MalM25]
MSRPLLEQLDRTATELTSVARSATVATALAAALGTAACLVLIDWLGRFNDPGLRWLFTGTLVAATAAAARYAWRRWRPIDANRLGVAQRLQTIRPELGSRLASAVEFAESDADDHAAGSAELRRAVVLGATQDADELPYREVVDRTPRRRAVRWLAASVAALAAFGLANPSALSSGLFRLAAPWADAPWPREVALRVVDPPTTLARGARFEATVVNQRGVAPADTRIEYRFPRDGERSARDESAPAQLVGDRAVATRESVQRSFAYRFAGGDDDTMAWIELAVLDPPVAESLSLTAKPPSYSGLPATTSSGPLRALAGSVVTLEGESDKALETASIVLPGAEPAGLLFRETGKDDPRGFEAIAWTAEPTAASATYEVRLTGVEGVTGVEGPHRYEVLADTPPALEWESSAPEVVVTSRALVPLKGTATDNLAIRRIEAEWSPTSEEGAEPARFTITESSEEPPQRDSLTGEDERAIAYDWDLDELGLEPGDELIVALVATDYRPAEGRTAEPRRVVVVSDEHYRARLAEAQSRLLGQVQQALAAQREANDATRSLGVDTRGVDSVGRAEIDRLTSIEYQQREASAAVDEPTTGAAAQAKRLLEDLRRSRLDADDLQTQLSAAGEALGRLAKNELPSARSDLASARRAARRSDAGEAEAKGEFTKRLGEAYTQQNGAVDRLEQVAELLTSWADYQRFAGEAAALEELQRDLAGEAQRQAAATASKLMVSPTQAEREQLITRQAEAGRRFDKLRQAMKKLLVSQPDDSQSAAAQSVGDALAEADDANVSGRQRDAARDLARGKLGSASQRQEAAADGLQSMVEALRQRATTDPEELARRLNEEKQKLAELQEQVEALKQRPDTRSTRAAREQTGQRAERLGRRLERLTAPQAAESASQGGQQASGQQGGQPQQQLAQAQESFKQAQREIDERLDELENQRTQRLLDQLTARIGEYIERQATVLDQTLGLANLRDAKRVRRGAGALAVDELDLADELSGFAEQLAKRAVFELALSGAAGQAESAAERLNQARVDRRTQRHETAALARLKQIEDVLRQEQEDRQQQEQNGGGGGGEGQGGQPKPPSPIDVAELKMLRLMQLEVLDETDAYEADTAAARRSRQPLPPDWEAAGRDLAGRQRRLAELALELSERDNDPEAEAPPE